MESLHVIIKPGYNQCCDCIDKQITFSKIKDCSECEKVRKALLHSFFMEKGKTYGIVNYPNGYFDTIELWRLMIDPDMYNKHD